MSSQSQIRQNYHKESEDGVNNQINMELYASYVYLAMSYHFDRDDVALPKIAEYFKECSSEEREHAMKLMKFQNQRGGSIGFKAIAVPPKSKWNSLLEAFEDALQLEKTVNQALLDLHKLAGTHEDAQMCNFLESEYLTEQVEAIKKLGDYISNLKLVGTGLGEFVFHNEFKLIVASSATD